MSDNRHFSRRAFAGMAAALAITSTFERAHAQGDTPLKVTASFSILADWVKNVGGDAVDVTSIVPAGGDAHTFDPDPATVASITDARVIFAIGPGFEPWLADMVEASGNTAPFVEIIDGITPLEATEDHDHEEDEEHGEEEHDHDHEHDHGDTDPHIWGDVHNAIAAVEMIRAGLAEVDPDNADQYQTNADAYTAQLEDLDASIREQIATIPEENRKLVTSHDTFAYYANAYGLEVLGTALGSLSTEAGDPSAKDIATLVEDIQESGVPAIFAENVVNPALMQSIADEAGVELAPTLYTDALGEAGTDGDTYIGMMTYNTATITAALSGE